MTKTPPPGGWNHLARSRVREEDALLHANSKPPPLTRDQLIAWAVIGLLCAIGIACPLARALGILGGST